MLVNNYILVTSLLLIFLSFQTYGLSLNINLPNIDLKNIKIHLMGEDDRVSLNSQEYKKFLPVGILENKKNKNEICNGTLISRDTILTAAHCLFDQMGNQIEIENFTFKAGVKNGKAISESKILSVITGNVTISTDGAVIDQSNFERDWAFLKLSHPLGDLVGWFEIANFDLSKLKPNYTDQPILIISYSKDFKNAKDPSASFNCYFQGQHFGNSIKHDCDTAYGSSGAPILIEHDNGDLVIAGINVGGHTSTTSIEFYFNPSIHFNIANLSTNFFEQYLLIKNKN